MNSRPDKIIIKQNNNLLRIKCKSLYLYYSLSKLEEIITDYLYVDKEQPNVRYLDIKSDDVNFMNKNKKYFPKLKTIKLRSCINLSDLNYINVFVEHYNYAFDSIESLDISGNAKQITLINIDKCRIFCYKTSLFIFNTSEIEIYDIDKIYFYDLDKINKITFHLAYTPSIYVYTDELILMDYFGFLNSLCIFYNFKIVNKTSLLNITLKKSNC